MSHALPIRVRQPSPGLKRHGAILAAIAMLCFCCVVRAAEPAEAEKGGVKLELVEPWSPRDDVAPKTSRTAANDVVIEANGTLTCAGGWQFHFADVRGGQAYRIRAEVEHHGLAHPTDCLEAQVMWDNWGPKQAAPGSRPMNFLLPKRRSADSIEFECCVKAPRRPRA